MKRNSVIFFTAILFGAISNLKAQSGVLFLEEYIDFSLDSNYFSINGIYSFQNKNNRAVNQQIMFPFADKSTEIDSIRVVNLYSGEKIDFIRKDSFIYFAIYLPVNDTVDVNIFYRQKTSAKNKYIITSTQSWGEPLKTAIYTLTAEKNLKIKSFSYSPDAVKELENSTLYTWKKHNFMPKEDFEVMLEE